MRRNAAAMEKNCEVVMTEAKAEDDDWSPADEAAQAAEEEAAQARLEQEKAEQAALSSDAGAMKADADKRMGMLDSLLDKTAMYSKFVSSQLTKPDAAPEAGATRSGAKRKAPAPASKKKKPRAAKAAKAKTTLAEIESTAVADQEQDVDQIGQPTLMTGAKMRDYQKQGVAWLKSLWENGMNGILGDEMGLGKTIQTIGMMAVLKEQNVPGPYLVVAPLSTLANWNREVPQWTKGAMTSQLYHGDQKTRAELQKGWKDVDVVVTSFEIAMRDIKLFQHPRFPEGKSGKAFRDEWKYLAVDEGHRLKNKDCRLIRELKSIHSANRLLLTGTPLQNDLSELWALLNFLLPSIFDDLKSFQAWFDFDQHNMNDEKRIIGMEKKDKMVSKLHTILRPFLLRRQKKDVDLDIPAKKEIILYCQNSAWQNELYTNVLAHRSIFAPESSDSDEEDNMGRGARERTNVCYDEDAVTERQWLKAVDSSQDIDALAARKTAKKHGEGRTHIGEIKGIAGAAAAPAKRGPSQTSLNNMLMQLRKVCNHPFLFDELAPGAADGETDEKIVECAGKMKLLDRLLPKLKKGGHKVLIFSQMTKVLSILEDYLIMRDYGYRRIDGNVQWQDRQRFMDEFNDEKGRFPDVFCFLLSTRAGGLGINLTAADTVVIFDSDWNPQADLQAQDRCHRIGQKKPVLVYRLCQKGTVEEKILERAANKRKLEHLVVSNGKFVTAGATSRADQVKALSSEELGELMQDNYADAKKDLEGVMSDKDIDTIMDRSKMFQGKAGAKGKGKSPRGGAAKASPKATKGGGEGAAFKMIEDEGGGMIDLFT